MAGVKKGECMVGAKDHGLGYRIELWCTSK